MTRLVHICANQKRIKSPPNFCFDCDIRRRIKLQKSWSSQHWRSIYNHKFIEFVLPLRHLIQQFKYAKLLSDISLLYGIFSVNSPNDSCSGRSGDLFLDQISHCPHHALTHAMWISVDGIKSEGTHEMQEPEEAGLILTPLHVKINQQRGEGGPLGMPSHSPHDEYRVVQSKKYCFSFFPICAVLSASVRSTVGEQTKKDAPPPPHLISKISRWVYGNGTWEGYRSPHFVR